MNRPVIILGGGGHAKVLIEALRASGVTILGITDADPAKQGARIFGVPVLGDDTEIAKHRPDNIMLLNGIGSVRQPALRQAVFEQFKQKGYVFLQAIHPSAVIASDAVIGEGAQIMAGAVIQPGCVIGANSIVNTRASIDHDCRIGAHVHIAPGVTLSGGAEVGAGTHVGAGATVIQGVRIGAGALIGAGSLVTRDIPAGVTAYGVPAKVMKK